MGEYIGKLQQEILLLLHAGVILAFTQSPNGRRRVFKELDKKLADIDRSFLNRSIESLYKNKIIDFKEDKNGLTHLVLLDKGKKKVLSYDIEKLFIKKPAKWDKKWRIIIFDVPESIRKVRDSMRIHLLQLGFYELQKSVFINPYPCWDEIDFIIEFYGIRKYVRQITANEVDNELHLKDIFKI